MQEYDVLFFRIIYISPHHKMAAQKTEREETEIMKNKGNHDGKLNQYMSQHFRKQRRFSKNS